MPFLAAIPAIGAASGALGTISTIGSAVGGVAGAIGGALGNTTGKNLAPELGYEAQGRMASQQSLGQLSDLVGAGAGRQDVEASLGSQRDLASLLQQYQQTGGLPDQAMIAQQADLAGQLFQGQRQQLRSNFEEQQQGFAQQAALQGRNPLDPVFRNKLAQEQTRQLRQLQADQGAFGIQQALAQPERQLNFAGQRAQVLGGLASQAMANRQALFNMGNQLQTSGQKFRADTASTTQGGGFGGGVTGFLGGIGAGAQLGKTIGQLTQGNPFAGVGGQAQGGITDARALRGLGGAY